MVDACPHDDEQNKESQRQRAEFGDEADVGAHGEGVDRWIDETPYLRVDESPARVIPASGSPVAGSDGRGDVSRAPAEECMPQVMLPRPCRGEHVEDPRAHGSVALEQAVAGEPVEPWVEEHRCDGSHRRCAKPSDHRHGGSSAAEIDVGDQPQHAGDHRVNHDSGACSHRDGAAGEDGNDHRQPALPREPVHGQQHAEQVHADVAGLREQELGTRPCV